MQQLTNTILSHSNIQKILLFICIFSSIATKSALAGPEAPEYIRTKNWSVSSIKGNSVSLKADIVFYNPNKVKARLKELDLDIFFNEQKVGTLTQNELVKIKGKSSFDIPIQLEFNLSEAGINLSNLLGLISNQKFLLNMNGFLKANVFLFPFKIKIDETEEFTLNDFL